jgi:putative hydrolase of the HAD superfamily
MSTGVNSSSSIQAVAFDIDGTLYPDRRLWVRIVPYVARHLPFFLAYGRVRRVLHRTAPLADFFEYQARLLAEQLPVTSRQARELIDSLIYNGLKPYFAQINPFAHAKETIEAFRAAGLKIALLSDFPPEQKGDIWGIAPLCDVILGSEKTGALKPSKYAFGALIQELGVAADKILYVGNSVRADIRGGKAAGMKTAYIMPVWRQILRKPLSEADISFNDYRQLEQIVLEWVL